MASELMIPFSRQEILPYPFDEGTPADRRVMAALELADWTLKCARLVLAVRVSDEGAA